jgi:poly(beta-D-mannuronate) lyase
MRDFLSRTPGRRRDPVARFSPPGRGSGPPAGRRRDGAGAAEEQAGFGWRLAVVFGPCLLIPGLAWAVCGTPPPLVRDIVTDRFYVAGAHARGDTGGAHTPSTLATLDHGVLAILAMTDRGLDGDEASARCAGRWLAAWAGGGAMLGRMSSQQAEIERKLRTAGIAMGYLKVRDMISARERAVIPPWLNKLADNVTADQGWPKRRTSVVYWTGFAVGAVGTATGAKRHLDDARTIYEGAMTDIRPDGTLSFALARRHKALIYLNHALAPLVMLAELAAMRGEDWYSIDHGAIHRLAARTLDGLRDPGGFADIAGVSSVDVPRGDDLGWLAFYRRRFPARVRGAPRGPFRDPWMGGDLTAMAKAWVKR